VSQEGCSEIFPYLCQILTNFGSGTDHISLLVLLLLGNPLQKSLSLCHFRSDQDEMAGLFIN